MEEDYIELEIAKANSHVFFCMYNVRTFFLLIILNVFFVSSYPVPLLFGSLAKELAEAL